MLGRIRKRKNHWTLIDLRDRLDDLSCESAADRADADDRRRFDTLDGSGEVVHRWMLVRIRLLKIDEVRTLRLQQTINVEKINPRLRLLKWETFLNHC